MMGKFLKWVTPQTYNGHGGPAHGTISGYLGGCGCMWCLSAYRANKDYQQDREQDYLEWLASVKQMQQSATGTSS
jgi:hypothetical protein